MPGEMGEGMEGVDDLLSPMPEEEEETPWYIAYWWVGLVIGVLGAAAVIALRFFKRSEPAAEEAGGEEDEGEGALEAADGGFPEAEVEVDEDEVEDFNEEIPEPEDLEPAETEE